MNHKIQFKVCRELSSQFYTEEHIYKNLILQMVNSLEIKDLKKFFKLNIIDPSNINVDELKGSEKKLVESLKEDKSIMYEVSFDPSEFLTENDIENRDFCFRNIKSSEI